MLSTRLPARSLPRRTSLALALLAALAVLALLAGPARADGSPDIALSADVPARVLLGKPATVTLTASNPAGQPTGYNLSFRDVLPAGVHYVGGSTHYDGATTDDPQVIVAGSGASQTTTLIWRNMGDLSPTSTGTLTYDVSHDTQLPSARVRTVGESYTEHPTAYISADERTVPAFDASGTYASGGPGSADAGVHTTTLSAIDLAIREGSPEGELLRGAHDHQTVFTLHVSDNDVDTTDPLTVHAYLPAGLEFLGCGDADNTTEAPTNTGGPDPKEEWDGSGSMADGNVAALDTAGCPAPDAVDTVNVDPDGSGPLPQAVYTKVTWANLPGVSPANPLDLSYVAAVPIRENTTTWTTAGGAPTGASGLQAANLDNNAGAETADEQVLSTYADVSGTYRTQLVSASSGLDRTAEDLRVVKTADNDIIDDGRLTRWTLDIATGEYRYVDDIRVSDTVPDGLCPLDTTNRESDQTADCAPAAPENAPSFPYSSIAENTTGAADANGSWTVQWDKSTDAELSRMQPSSDVAIAYTTRSRLHYQQDGADAGPVLARDSWTNAVSLLGADYARCVGSAAADCGTTSGVPGSGDPLASRVAHDETDGVDDVDASAATQKAGAPTLDKTIRTRESAVPVDCSGGTYTDGPADGYGPGDRVCYRLRVQFPSALDTGTPSVTDFLPDGVTYVSSTPTGANTVTIASTTGDGGGVPAAGDSTITWTLGGGSDTATNGQVFEVTLVADVVDPNAGLADDVKGNLMKLSYENTAGQSFPLRDEADFDWAEPQLTLVEGVKQVDHAQPASGNGRNVDGVEVHPGATVTVRVDVDNIGNAAADSPVVDDRLPDGVTCAGVDSASIAPAGACHPASDAPGIGNDYVQWTLASIPAAGGTTLTYDYTVPTGIAPGTTYANHAGVVSYQGATDAAESPDFSYYPASDIDPAHAGPANTVAADDPTSVHTAPPAITHASASADIDQVGNESAAATATIGERISYTTTVTIPEGTLMQDGASPASVSIPLGTGQTLLLGTPALTLNGSPAPSGFTVADTGDATVGSIVTVDFPADYVPTGDDKLEITYQATVDDESTNVRGGAVDTTATLAYTDAGGTRRTPSASTGQTIVEPDLTVGKADDDADGTIAPGQTVRYTITVGNPAGGSVSAANGISVVDDVPAGMTPLDAGGNPMSGNGTTSPDAGAWDAAARTITFTVPTALAPGATTSLSYDLRVDDPQVGDTTKSNSVTATAGSYPSDGSLLGTERNATSAGSEGLGGYEAGDTDDVTLVGMTVDKTVDKPKATVGEQRTFTLDVTIPGGINAWDGTVVDQLPDGLDYDGEVSAECVTPGCSPAITVSELPHEDNADGSTTLGFFLGDLAAAPSDQPRTVRITYHAHVDDHYEPEGTDVKAGQALSGAAAVYSDTGDTITGTPSSIPDTGTFDRGSASPAAKVTVTEPHVTVDKDVSGQAADTDTRGAQPGDTLTYTLTVANTGAADAHDVVVSDAPDTELVSVAPGTLPSGVALTDGWDAADRDLQWTIDTIPAGASVTLTYTAELAGSATLHEADQAVNTADVPAYYAIAQAQRTADAFDYRQYGSGAYDVTPDTVTVDVDLPQPTVNLAVGPPSAPDDESRPAEIDRGLTWNVILGNDSDTATLHGVDVTVRLPRDWTYEAGSAGVYGDPVVAKDADNGDLLTWTNLEEDGTTPTTVGPHDRVELDFVAAPGYAAKSDIGTGAANPHIAHATVAGDDASGASGSADGAYAAGPDPAQAVLQVPQLVVTKTPDSGTVTAGTTGSWNVHVANSGDGTARDALVTDTIPDGVTYTAGSATSTNGGFAEQSDTLNADGTRTVVWKLADLAPTTSADITVPVGVAAGDDAGTVYTNTASAAADEEHAGESPQQSDSGALTVQSRADMAAGKTVTPSTQAAGKDVTYTLTATNLGDSEARSATLTDSLPTGVSFVAFGTADDEGDCSQSAGTVACTFGTLQPGATRTVKVTAHLASSLTGTVTNTASVATTTTDPIGTDDTVSTPVTVTEQANLKVTKVARTSSVLQGTNATYDVTVENAGPSDARGVQLTDTLPSGMTLVSISSGDGTCSATTTSCDLGTIAAGTSKAAVVVARADGTGPLDNTASATTTADDSDPTDNSDTEEITSRPAVDLAVTKTGPTTTVAAGAAFDYTLTATNHGPSDGTGVTVTDTLPEGIAFVSADPEQGDCAFDADSHTLTCDLGDLANGAGAGITLHARAGFSLADRHDIDNTAHVSGDQEDPDSSNDSDDAAVDVGPAADLTVTKTADIPDPARSGNALEGRDVVYTVKVANAGPSTATDVTLTDTLPAGTSFRSLAVPAGWSCTTPAVGAGGTVDCSIAALPDAADASFELTVRADEPGTPDNTATVSSDQPDEHAGDNSDSAQVTVDPAVDLGVEKSGPAHVVAGQTATYTLTVTNHGPSDATDVEVTDALPDGLDGETATSTQGTCAYATATDTATCELGDLAEGETATVTVTARAEYAAAEQALTDRADVTGDQQDPNGANDESTVATTVGPAADVHVQKVTLNPLPHQQRTFAYRITTGNDGPSTASDVTMTDTLPGGVRYEAVNAPAGASCSQASRTVTCHLGDIPRGAARVVQITVTAVELNVWRNTASASSPTVDPDGTNNASSADVNVGPTANLALTKTGPRTVAANGDVTYRLTATNSGPSAATHAVLTDRLPAGIEFRAAHTEAGRCSAAGGTVTCALGRIEVGQTVTVTVAAHASFAAAGRSVLNTATVTAAEDDIDLADNSATHAVLVGPAADVSVVKSAPARVPAESRLLYTLQVHDAGPQAATGAVVADTLPAGATPVAAGVPGGACAIAGQVVTCRLATLPAGATAQVALTARVAAGTAGRRLVNVATVKAAQPDPNPANNSGAASTTVELPVRTAGNLSVTDKVHGGRRTTELGRRVTFLMTIRNSTDRPATGVTAIGALRSAADVVALDPQKGHCRLKTLTCKLGRLAVGQRTTIRLVVVPKQPGSVRHSVTITSEEGDRDTSDNQAHARAKVITRKTRFRLTKRATRKAVVAGHKATFVIRARNRGGHAAANVRVCDTPGKGMSFAGTHGAKLRRGRACWKVRYWPAGTTRTFKVTVRVNRDVTHRAFGRVRLTARNARQVKRKASVRVRGAGEHGGGVTG